MTAGARDHLWRMSATEAVAALAAGDVKAIDLVDSVLSRSAETEPTVHAWVEIFSDQARNDARERDQQQTRGIVAGPLHGLPIAIKDIYDVAGSRTLCGSKSRKAVEPAERDARTVQLLRNAGAILLGKTVTQEFAAGVVSVPARNPWDPGRIPGGSSGGSAAAVAAGSAMAAMGSDTGGSIRIPASVCGVVGFKPTYGLLSLDGVFPLSWSLDTAGPITRTVADAALLFDVLRDSHRESRRVVGQTIRIGVPRTLFFDRLQDGVRQTVERALQLISGDGINIVTCDWPEASVARACSFVINRVETAAIHRRSLAASGHLYGEELRKRVQASALFPATGYTDALQARAALRDSVARVYADFDLDLMLTPSTPGVAAPADHTFVNYSDGSEEHVSLAYTRLTMPFNVTGQPALSLPCGFDEQGLPTSLQIAGVPYGDDAVLQIGAMIEERLMAVAGHGGLAPERLESR